MTFKSCQKPFLNFKNSKSRKFVGDFIAGLMVGDGHVSLGAKHGGKSLERSAIKPRMIMTQNDKHNCLPELKEILKDKYDINSTLQNFTVSRGSNLYIEGVKNCKKLTTLLLKANTIGPKSYKIDFMNALFKKYYNKRFHLKPEGKLALIDARKCFSNLTNSRTLSTNSIETAYGFSKGQSNGCSLELRQKVAYKEACRRKKLFEMLKAGKLTLSPGFICGFVAAEGYFCTGIRLPDKWDENSKKWISKNSKTKKPKKPVVKMKFSLSGSIFEKETLEILATQLEEKSSIEDLSGKVHKSKIKKAYTYRVSDLRVISKMITFFEKYPFVIHETKQTQFENFSSPFQMVKEKQHLTKEGFLKIAQDLYNTPFRQDHNSRNYSFEQLEDWADFNWPG